MLFVVVVVVAVVDLGKKLRRGALSKLFQKKRIIFKNYAKKQKNAKKTKKNKKNKKKNEKSCFFPKSNLHKTLCKFVEVRPKLGRTSSVSRVINYIKNIINKIKNIILLSLGGPPP